VCVCVCIPFKIYTLMFQALCLISKKSSAMQDFGLLTAMLLKTPFFWDVQPRRLRSLNSV